MRAFDASPEGETAMPTLLPIALKALIGLLGAAVGGFIGFLLGLICAQLTGASGDKEPLHWWLPTMLLGGLVGICLSVTWWSARTAATSIVPVAAGVLVGSLVSLAGLGLSLSRNPAGSPPPPDTPPGPRLADILAWAVLVICPLIGALLGSA